VKANVNAVAATQQGRFAASAVPLLFLTFALWPYLLSRSSYLYVCTQIPLSIFAALGASTFGSRLTTSATVAPAPLVAAPTTHQLLATISPYPPLLDESTPTNATTTTQPAALYRVASMGDRALKQSVAIAVATPSFTPALSAHAPFRPAPLALPAPTATTRF
jgi:hypothetical protein